MTQTAETTIRCPTCRLTQDWTETCRRCKSDLRLLHRALEASHLNRTRCLKALHEGRLPEAYRLALHGVWLRPTTDSHRLAALCALLNEDWPNAWAIAGSLPPDDAARPPSAK